MSTSRGKILLVDDDADLLRLMSMRVEAAGFQALCAKNADEALLSLRASSPLAVVTDLRMEGMDGLALFEAIHHDNPLLPVIILTAHGTIPDAVGATRRGVFAFLTKPFDGRELIEHIDRAVALGGAQPGSGEHQSWAGDIITQSPIMNVLLDRARRIAETEVSVLILGMSGTGKELLALALHRASKRRSGPFVAINCAAIPETLLESELFGHTRGAFTGAVRDQIGLIQAADGGTLFLDEIGDMPGALQAKLLRALQDRQIRPLGSQKSVSVNVRVISATHQDLDKSVQEGRFREDLYYRLNVARLVLPGLDERREDIPLLVRHRLTVLRDQSTLEVEGFAPDALDQLICAAWPGNIRQLFNVVDHCHALATTSLIPASIVSLVLAVRDQSPGIESLERARARFDQDYLIRLMKMTSGNVARAAQLAGRNRTDLYKLLRRCGIDPNTFKDE